jgi:hypothetical protein
MVVKYTPVVHDGPHTIEQQMLLLAKAGDKAWRAWFSLREDASKQVDLDNAMRDLYQQLYQTDVFMGGLHEGERRAR